MITRFFLSISFICLLFITGFSQDQSVPDITPAPPPQVALGAYALSYKAGAFHFESKNTPDGWTPISIENEKDTLLFIDGHAQLSYPAQRKGALIMIEDADHNRRLFHLSLYKSGLPRLRPIPMWLSILPPIIAIGLALIFKEVLISLFVGIWSGAFIIGGLRFESFGFYWRSLWEVVEKYMIGALTDSGHLSVILFSMLIGGMVAIISRNGGMAGVVSKLAKFARTPRSAQMVTWALGVAIFFDDYANTLIVGNTMRPITDRFRISREKLAYIVDSTAAPVAAIAFITTWIGAELGYISDGIAGLEGFEGGSAYSVFLSSLKYSFYPFLTLCFMVMLILWKKDFGPMFKAEVRVRKQGTISMQEGDSDRLMEELEPEEGIPHRGFNAIIPVLLVIFVTLLGLFSTGFDAMYDFLVSSGVAVENFSWSAIWEGMSIHLGEASNTFMKLGLLIGYSDSYTALIWSSLTGVVAAILLSLGGRLLKITETMRALVTGFKTMLPAILILILAWSLAITTKELHTADFLSASLENALNPYWVPVLIFVLAAFISFSTGSSWSTMAILYPLAIPLSWSISQSAGLDPAISQEILLNVIAGVLGASVLGDHCSPISDTTILSSLASSCNHIDHVRTQMPYALVVGTVSMVCTGLSTRLGGGAAISTILYVSGIGVMALVIWRMGRVPEDEVEELRS